MHVDARALACLNNKHVLQNPSQHAHQPRKGNGKRTDRDLLVSEVGNSVCSVHEPSGDVNDLLKDLLSSLTTSS
ncbi:unnamed protein product [Pleuronectes platessa]|uniref:Uncharacterized protein n=1 Tax=Pleuronectes platessa TaxID=8262 RepID=A0A9N7VER7_PLEPL|nr:unnamed protein product [Pleuronectes platessa]